MAIISVHERFEFVMGNVAIGGAAVALGGFHILAGLEVITVGCAATGGLGCPVSAVMGIYAIATGVGMVVGGAVWTTTVTIPSIQNLFSVPR